MRLKIGINVVLIIALASTAREEMAKAATFLVSPPSEIMTKEDRTKFGLCCFPDMPMGIVRSDGGKVLIIAPGGSVAARGRIRGSFVFSGTLDAFAPTKVDAGGALPSMRVGREQPSPDGSDFDLDYAGGGTTYYVNSINGELSGKKPAGAAPLLMTYHGEFHNDTSSGKLYYAGLGLAISKDGGSSFSKLGQLLEPRVARKEYFDWMKGQGRKGGLSNDGALIEADAQGRKPAAPSTAGYYYIMFPDQESVPFRGAFPFALARVKKSEALAAIAAGHAPVFKKYFEPPNAPKGSSDLFTEPGRGGHFTPILTMDVFVAQPLVYFSDYLKKFVLVYGQGQKKIFVRTGEDLFHWSEPEELFAVSDADQKVLYPTIVGLGPDPVLLDKDFYLYFVRSSPQKGENAWRTAVLSRVKVSTK